MVQKLAVAPVDPAPDRPVEIRGRALPSHAIHRPLGEFTYREWPGDLVAGGGLCLAHKVTLLPVGGGGGEVRMAGNVTFFPGGGGSGLGMVRKMTFFPVGGGGLDMARRMTFVPVDGGGGVGMARKTTIFPVDGGGSGLGMVPRSTSFFLVGSGARLCRARRRPHLPLDVKFHRSSVRPGPRKLMTRTVRNPGGAGRVCIATRLRPPVQPNKASSRDTRLPDRRAIVAATTLQSRAISSLLASSARLSAME